MASSAGFAWPVIVDGVDDYCSCGSRFWVRRSLAQCASPCRRSRGSRLCGLRHPQLDELRGPNGRESHQYVDPSVAAVVLSRGRRVALNDVGGLGSRADQRALFPQGEHEFTYSAADPAPELLVVGLEHRPRQTLFNVFLDVERQAHMFAVVEYQQSD